MKKPVEMPAPPRHPRRRLVASSAALSLLLTASLLAGCTSVRNGLGSRDTICFRVIPEARAAVGPAAKFEGARALPAKALLSAAQDAQRAHLVVPKAIREALKEPTCLIAFDGNFKPAEVKRSWTVRGGPYHVAIVVMLQSKAKVVAAVLLKSMPLRFAHYFAFER